VIVWVSLRSTHSTRCHRPPTGSRAFTRVDALLPEVAGPMTSSGGRSSTHRIRCWGASASNCSATTSFPAFAGNDKATLTLTRHARPCAGYPRLKLLGGEDMDGRDKPGHDGKTGVAFPLTSVTISVTDSESRSGRGVTGDSRLMGRVRFLRVGLVTPLPGGSGHHSCRYYGRCGRCCPWTGTGEGG
jgi:hypothetical protein